MKRILQILIFSLFACTCLSISAAQDKEVENEDDEFNKRLILMADGILSAEVSKDFNKMYRQFRLIDNSAINATILDDKLNFKLSVETNVDILPMMIFSFTINDPYIGSPAYGVTGPRHSLNIDRITGKYYWEW